MAKLQMVKDGHLGGYVHGGDPGTWCPHLWTWVVETLAVQSMLDVGCGEGHSANYFRRLGCRVRGVEGCRRAIDDSVIPEDVDQHDYCDGPYVPERSYDLIWSCEFLEHVDRAYVVNLLPTFAFAKKAILVTHAFPGQEDGHHHVNCRPSSYWIRVFEHLGFDFDEKLTLAARTVTLKDYHGVNHFARSGLVFRRAEDSGVAIGEVPERCRGADITAMPKRFLSAKFRAFCLNARFRWSAAFRAQRRSKRIAKRAAGIKD